jgi:hypothetical protein
MVSAINKNRLFRFMGIEVVTVFLKDAPKVRTFPNLPLVTHKANGETRHLPCFPVIAVKSIFRFAVQTTKAVG